jgi:hypothetical protein
MDTGNSLNGETEVPGKTAWKKNKAVLWRMDFGSRDDSVPKNLRRP